MAGYAEETHQILLRDRLEGKEKFLQALFRSRANRIINISQSYYGDERTCRLGLPS